MASFQVQAISVPLLLPNRQTVYRGVQTKTNTAVYQGNFTNTVWERVWPLPPQGEGQIPFAYVIDVAQPLSISLGAIFVPTPQWADQNSGGGFYMVELRSGDNLVLRSDPQIVQPAVDVDAFKFVQPGQILGPFKSGTQWTASIICCNAGGLPGEWNQYQHTHERMHADKSLLPQLSRSSPSRTKPTSGSKPTSSSVTFTSYSVKETNWDTDLRSFATPSWMPGNMRSCITPINTSRLPRPILRKASGVTWHTSSSMTTVMALGVPELEGTEEPCR